MPKPKPNLASVLDDLPRNSAPASAERQEVRPSSIEDKGTVLVGANLPPRYARNLALLHAETGKSKKLLLQEALDMLFTAKGGRGLQ